MDLDRIRGMFAAFALGDALGAPHEFAQNWSNIYTGKLELQGFRFNRFTQTKSVFDIGGITDDSELTIALLSTIQNKEYCVDRALLAYLDWANSGCPHLGVNTRALFQGVKTKRGYTNRYNKVTQGEISQSNGSLMRCSPLALVDNWRELTALEVSAIKPQGFGRAVILDCNLSNPNVINRDCSLVYVGWLRSLLKGKSVEHALCRVVDPCDEVYNVLEEEERDISGKDKGWVLNRGRKASSKQSAMQIVSVRSGVQVRHSRQHRSPSS